MGGSGFRLFSHGLSFGDLLLGGGVLGGHGGWGLVVGVLWWVRVVESVVDSDKP